jgi:hypothetical protein
VEWAEARQKWLRTFLLLRRGIPSADTVRRIFEAISPKKFTECRLVAHLATEMPDQLIANSAAEPSRLGRQGAAGARTCDASGQGPLHMVSAWAVERGVVLGQVATRLRKP